MTARVIERRSAERRELRFHSYVARCLIVSGVGRKAIDNFVLLDDKFPRAFSAATMPAWMLPESLDGCLDSHDAASRTSASAWLCVNHASMAARSRRASIVKTSLRCGPLNEDVQRWSLGTGMGSGFSVPQLSIQDQTSSAGTTCPASAWRTASAIIRRFRVSSRAGSRSSVAGSGFTLTTSKWRFRGQGTITFCAVPPATPA